METITQLAAASREWVVDLRRHFHMRPELGGEEIETQAKIMEELRKLGLEPRPAAGTGVIAEITGMQPGKCVALRADIDALPLQDEIDQPYRSKNAGRCHACGHDAHTAMLLGAAKVLSQQKESIQGKIRFLFQPSEEQFPGGAKAMIAEGAMQGVDRIFGTHVWQDVKAGHIGVTYGRMMASPDAFTICIQGRGGHGSMPHQTVDPIFVGSQIVVALKSIIGCNMDPLEPVVLSMGMFRAGEVYNVIPDKATLLGTVRTFDTKVRERVFRRIEEIAIGIAAASGATVVIEPMFGYSALINHPDISRVIAEVGAEVLGPDNVKEIQPVMGGEDFSFYLDEAPGAFFFLGVGNPEKGIVYPHHHPRFDIDEDVLPAGVEILARTALRLLR